MSGNDASRPPVVTETITIAGDTEGVNLQLLHKFDPLAVMPGRTLLLMHGATFPSASLFDVPVADGSFMDVLARDGHDAWALDARGYGGSTRPPEMRRPPEDAAPLTPATVALRDLDSAVAHVRQLRGIEQVDLLGMSWGATVAGAYAAAHPARVERLVLIVPLWLSDAKRRIDPGGALGAYRFVDVQAYGTAWRDAAPESERAGLIPDGWFEAWHAVTLATDPGSTAAGRIRAPCGAVQDTRDHWTIGKPLYDPASIRAPVLVVAAEWDIDVTPAMARDLFDRLTGTRRKRFVEIAGATHMVLLERNRREAIDAVTGFLGEPP